VTDQPIILQPGATIGLLGGGQLARMLSLAAAPLGYRCHIYDPSANAPAAQVSAAHTVAAFDDEEALGRFGDNVDVVSFEFESEPARTAQILSEHVLVRPNAGAFMIAQDRLLEKNFVNDSADAPTAAFAPVDDLASLKSAIAEIGLPAVLKTRREGYDGKGQVMVRAESEAEAALEAIGHAPAILEGFVRFDREASVVIARSITGETAPFDLVENIHTNHILSQTLAPARLDPAIAHEAQAIAARIAEAMDYVGVLAVEFFVEADGSLRVNEIAPRVHNSGHWTIEACYTSQFEQHIRAITGQPLGDPARHADAVMDNLIGDQAKQWPALLAEPRAHLHLYGKTEIRPGRKMGHVTRLYPLGERPARA